MTTKLVVDCSTGEVQEIALTAEEIAQREADALAAAEAESARLAEEADKAVKKAELLERLGITEEEAQLLLS
jgi:hypothetical protein